MMKKRKLLIIGRAPIPGEAKKRLAADVGEKWAHRYYLAMLEDFFQNLSSHQNQFHEIILSIDPYNEVTQDYFLDLLERHEIRDFELTKQHEGPFFERLHKLLEIYKDESSSIHLTGTDVPNIDYSSICLAELQNTNYLGPDRDGGFYYGIFNKNAFNTFYKFVPSSSELVFNELFTQIEACKSLEISSDLDNLRDISVLYEAFSAPEHLNFVHSSYLLEQKRLLSGAERRA